MHNSSSITSPTDSPALGTALSSPCHYFHLWQCWKVMCSFAVQHCSNLHICQRINVMKRFRPSTSILAMDEWGNIFLNNEPVWSAAARGKLCSARKSVNATSARIFSSSSALEKNEVILVDAWRECTSAIAFAWCFLVLKLSTISLAPPHETWMSHLHSLQNAWRLLRFDSIIHGYLSEYSDLNFCVCDRLLTAGRSESIRSILQLCLMLPRDQIGNGNCRRAIQRSKYT